METKSSERRYNTRFRGVPRSVFTYSRSGKKSSKSNNENSLRTEIRDDFVYTKLGKKSSSHEKEADSPPKLPTKSPAKPKPEISDVPVPSPKHEPSPPMPESAPTRTASPKPTLVPAPALIPNGTHKPSSEVSETANSKNTSHESSPEMSPPLEKEMDGIFFETKADSEDINPTSTNGTKSVWIESKEKLTWNNSTVASYNPKTKMFKCVVCQAVGFMSRIGEHYLGTHCNAKVFHCPQCSYCSAWWRCVRNHMSKNHGVSNAPASMWKNQPLLDEIMQILQNLKYSVDCEDRVERVAENYGKRYICPKCPYATDRRDLYNRHENIHREEKPFQCYICYKLFNRADHVKKHFCRIHKEFNYDINLIRRLPSKRSRIPVSPSLNGGSSRPSLDLNASFSDIISRPTSVPVTQSQLLSCLTGSPTMVRVTREIDHVSPNFPEKEIKTEEKNDNTFNKSHSNLLTFLTQNAFSTKSSHKPPPPRNTDTPIKDILQEALLKPPGYSSFLSSSQPKKFMCPYCPWTGPNSWALRLHTSMHYKTFCVLCNFKSTEASDLENHMWECHKKRSCNKCNFLADSLLALDAHMLEVQ